jgi:hypothetical protein
MRAFKIRLLISQASSGTNRWGDARHYGVSCSGVGPRGGNQARDCCGGKVEGREVTADGRGERAGVFVVGDVGEDGGCDGAGEEAGCACEAGGGADVLLIRSVLVC